MIYKKFINQNYLFLDNIQVPSSFISLLIDLKPAHEENLSMDLIRFTQQYSFLISKFMKFDIMNEINSTENVFQIIRNKFDFINFDMYNSNDLLMISEFIGFL